MAGAAADSPLRAARPLTRRQALKIVAAAGALTATAAGLKLAAADPQFFTWDGEALGARSHVALWHDDPRTVRSALAQIRSELGRLERIFSLFRRDSEISRLNREGSLDKPSADLRHVIAVSREMSELSAGAFDPTVQPLWELYSRHFRSRPTGDGPPAADIAQARARVGFRALDLDSRRVAFARPGMAITLNGIAQGYIADRIADMLRSEGFDHVFIELGEIRALGAHPEGRDWTVALKDPRDPLRIGRTIGIADEAMAISGGYGTPFDAAGRHHHLFDPQTGMSAQRLLDVAVIGPAATVADALSTAIFVAGETAAPALLAAWPGMRAEMTRPDGSLARIG